MRWSHSICSVFWAYFANAGLSVYVWRDRTGNRKKVSLLVGLAQRYVYNSLLAKLIASSTAKFRFMLIQAETKIICDLPFPRRQNDPRMSHFKCGTLESYRESKNEWAKDLHSKIRWRFPPRWANYVIDAKLRSMFSHGANKIIFDSQFSRYWNVPTMSHLKLMWNRLNARCIRIVLGVEKGVSRQLLPKGTLAIPSSLS